MAEDEGWIKTERRSVPVANGRDSIECPQQKCLIHLIRDMNDDLDLDEDELATMGAFDLDGRDAWEKLKPILVEEHDRRAYERTRTFADSQIKSLMTAPLRGSIESADRSLHNYFEQFTWLYANRICFDANPLYSGSNVGQRDWPGYPWINRRALARGPA